MSNDQPPSGPDFTAPGSGFGWTPTGGQPGGRSGWPPGGPPPTGPGGPPNGPSGQGNPGGPPPGRPGGPPTGPGGQGNPGGPPPGRPGGPPTGPGGPSGPPGGWVPPGPPVGRSGGSIWLGLGLGLAGLVASFFGTQWLSAYLDIAFALLLVAPIVLIIGGIVLAANPRTRRTGAGVLIAVGGAVLILGGLCIALIAGLGGLW